MIYGTTATRTIDVHLSKKHEGVNMAVMIVCALAEYVVDAYPAESGESSFKVTISVAPIKPAAKDEADDEEARR